MLRLILIRHGLTNYNLKKKYCGFKDVGLNKIGRDKLKQIKTKLKGLKIDKVFCSDLKRSWQTAKILFDSKCPMVKKSNLREINFGKWEGLSFRQILKRYPVVYRKWWKAPFAINIPGGEKMSHFLKRINKESKNIIEGHRHKNIAVIGHAGPIRVILNTAWEVKRKNFWQIKLEPQAVYVVEYKDQLKSKVYKL